MLRASIHDGVATWWGGDALVFALDGATSPLTAVTLSNPGGAGATASGRMDSTFPIFQGLTTVFLPQTGPSTNEATVVFTDATGSQADATLPVYAPLYGSYTFALRGYLPGTWDAGPRGMPDVPTLGETQPSNLAVLTAGLAAGLNTFGGTPLTRLSADVQAGDAMFHVEHAATLPSDGRAQIDGIPYTYSTRDPGPAAPTLGGIGISVGGGTISGAQASHATGSQVAFPGAPVTDLVLTKDAVFLDTAEGPFLTAIGRNLGVAHSASVADDDQYRALVKAIAYGPKTSVYGIELALDALLGAGNYTLREDPVGAPCQVVIGVSYTALTQAGSLGRSYLGAETQVVPDAGGDLALDAPVFGVSAIHPVSGTGIDRRRDLNLLEGTASTAVDPAPVTLAGAQVPAQLVTPSVPPLAKDVGVRVDHVGGAQPGRYVIAGVRGGAWVVHQGIYDNATLSSAGTNLVTLRVPMPDGAHPESSGPFVYPRDVGRTVAAGGRTGTITAVLDSATGANMASYATPLVQRSDLVVVSGLGLPAQAGLTVAVLPIFPTQTQVPYRTAGAYVSSTTGDTTTLSRRAPVAAADAGLPTLVCHSDVLSAQIQASPDVETTFVGNPPMPDRYRLFINAPFAVLNDYLDDLTAAGVKATLEYF